MSEANDTIIEFITHGRFVRVTAIDPKTGREVTIVGDAALPRDKLAQEAIKKLKYMMKK